MIYSLTFVGELRNMEVNPNMCCIHGVAVQQQWIMWGYLSHTIS